MMNTDAFADLPIIHALGSQQHNARSSHQRRRTLFAANNAFEFSTLMPTDPKFHCFTCHEQSVSERHCDDKLIITDTYAAMY